MSAENKSKKRSVSQNHCGPFKIDWAEVPDNGELEVPMRQYSCDNYETCLNLAAALNWENFSCEGCDGNVNQALCWQARHAQKRDGVVSRICDLPEIELHGDADDNDDLPAKPRVANSGGEE